MEQDLRVCAVTVTYGDRFRMLSRLIEAALREGVRRVIVVDNCSAAPSASELDRLCAEKNGQVRVIRLTQNLGSAGGFKTGIESAYGDGDCEYFWILDDDNVPEKGALDALMAYWLSIGCEEKEKQICLSSFRVGDSGKEMAVWRGDPLFVLGRKNGFWGFHLADLPRKVFVKIFGIQPPVVRERRVGEVVVAPYGGLFLHRQLIEKIGYPDERFFVYVDDYDFTYRIHLSGGRIIALLDSRIIDLQKTWESSGGNFHILRMARAEDRFRLFYTARNMAYFLSRNHMDFRLIFFANFLVYFLTFSVVAIFSGKPENAVVLFRAFFRGVRGDLGRLPEGIG